MKDTKDTLTALHEIDIDDFISNQLSPEKIVRFQTIFKSDWVEIKDDLRRLIDTMESMEYFYEQYAELRGRDKDIFEAEFALCDDLLEVFWKYHDRILDEAQNRKR